MNRPPDIILTPKKAQKSIGYTAPTDAGILDNIADALVAGRILARLGFAPIIPHTMGSHRVTWAQAMVRCHELVAGLDPEQGDFLCVLPGWQTSRGAREERQLALDLGITVREFEEVIR